MRLRHLFATVLAAVLAAGLASGGAIAADAAKGEKNYRQCKACHTLEPGKKRVGPTLHNLFGRTAGTVEKFKYSTDLKAAGEKGLVWNEETLMAYLKDPTAFLKQYLGKKKVTNKMKNKFRREAFRQDVIAYLKEATK